MADDVERELPPSPKKRQEALKKGQVATSREVGTVANLLGVTLALMLMGVGILHQGMLTFRTLWVPRADLSLEEAMQMLRIAFGSAGKIMLPILLAALGSGVIAGLLQTRGNISMHPLKPKASKINPIKNFSNIVKKSAPVDLVKSLGKLAIIGTVLWYTITRHIHEFFGLSRLPLVQIASFQLEVVLEAFLAGAVAMVAIAIADYAYQWWQYEKNLKMSVIEKREERKQQEGDPHVKARQRSLQMEKARTRMMQAVPDADVIVTNPTHLSVALSYKREDMTAPTVVAKGAGFVALKIREIAREAGIPIVENRPLAQTLYRSVKVGSIVPERLYQAIAELLAYVYRLDREKARAW